MIQVNRNIDALTRTVLAIDFTRPVYLVKMLFEGGSVFMSSGPQTYYAGDVYIEGQVSVSTISWDSDGNQTGSIKLSNENNAATALLLGNDVNDVLIEIYQTYLIVEGGNTPPQGYLKGSMDGSKVGASDSTVRVLSTTSRTGFVPNRYFTVAAGFNWLPIAGETIVWGSEVFDLQESKN